MNTLIKAKNIYLEYTNQTILDIESLQVGYSQKIGIVGSNGSGKSSLLRSIVNKINGDITCNGTLVYVPQSNRETITNTAQEQHDSASLMSKLSGGELMQQKITDAFSQQSHALILDEPTNDLDQNAIASLIGQLKYFPGAIVLVSHDRDFLNQVVDTIWELKETKLKVYHGNYDHYEFVLAQEHHVKNSEYQKFYDEKKRLEAIALNHREQGRKSQHKKPNKTESGGRLAHAKGTDTKQKAMMRKAKEVEKRILAMDEVERPKQKHKIGFHLSEDLSLNNKYPIMVRNLTIRFDEKVLFESLDFDIALGSKTALKGKNGSGKTTLMKTILEGGDRVILAPKVKIGYFAQNSIDTIPDMNVLDYLSSESDYPVHQLRAMLFALGFKKDVIRQHTHELSGGECMKLVLAQLFTGRYNVLMLDEPTNNLDIDSIKAIEACLKDYTGTLVLVSHDTKLIAEVCTEVIDLD